MRRSVQNFISTQGTVLPYYILNLNEFYWKVVIAKCFIYLNLLLLQNALFTYNSGTHCIYGWHQMVVNGEMFEVNQFLFAADTELVTDSEKQTTECVW